MPLPSPNNLITSLTTTLSLSQTPLTPHHKPLLTTIHLLFPTLFLPALDLLDRKLITRITPAPSPGAGHPDSDALKPVFYIVQSTGGRKEGKIYFVHLRAWNCTCVAFVLESFLRGGTYLRDDAVGSEDRDDLFGGLGGGGLGGMASPCCKHLLACYLAERWRGGLGDYVVERAASREEIAALVGEM